MYVMGNSNGLSGVASPVRKPGMKQLLPVPLMVTANLMHPCPVERMCRRLCRGTTPRSYNVPTHRSYDAQRLPWTICLKCCRKHYQCTFHQGAADQHNVPLANVCWTYLCTSCPLSEVPKSRRGGHCKVRLAGPTDMGTSSPTFPAASCPLNNFK